MAIRLAGDKWEEIKLVSDLVIHDESKSINKEWQPLEFSGEAELRLKDAYESISKVLRKKPKMESWKSPGKRKMPRIK